MTNPSATKNRIGRFTWLLVTNALCLSPLFGQVDANALRAKYGPPVEEVFVLRPGITLSIVYGEKHQVCKLDIRPARNASVIPAALIEEMLNEVVPPFTRGTLKRQWAVCSGFCRKFAAYENISISQAAGDVTPDPEAQTQMWLAVVQVKSCQVPKP